MVTEDQNPPAHRRTTVATCVDCTLMNMGFTVPMDRLRPRMYDPTVGRFVSFDAFEAPSSDPTHLHKYNYAGTDPVNHIDPSGEDFNFVSLMVTTGIGVALYVMLFPNVANAPGPRDRVYPDRGGDMVFGAVVSVAVAPAVKLTLDFVVSPAIKWAAQGVTRMLRRPPPVQATRLYRVITEPEFQHIQQTRQILADPSGRGYQTGKWFWKDTSSIPKWVERNPSVYKDGYRVVQVDVPPEIMSTAMQRVNHDQIGDAVFIKIEKLIDLAAKEVTR